MADAPVSVSGLCSGPHGTRPGGARHTRPGYARLGNQVDHGSSDLPMHLGSNPRAGTNTGGVLGDAAEGIPSGKAPGVGSNPALCLCASGGVAYTLA